MILALLLSALSVLPADRLALADRLFNKGQYAKAQEEYVSLKATNALPQNELEFRLGECERRLGRNEKARNHYLAAVKVDDPTFRLKFHARLNAALTAVDEETKIKELELLNSDSVDNKVRAVACYHLGLAKSDTELFTKSIKLDPNGDYALYARFVRASKWIKSEDEELRKKAVEDLLTIAFSSDKSLGDDALYLAAVESYTSKRYSQAATMLRRYSKNFPNGKHVEEAMCLRAWSYYLAAMYLECAQFIDSKDGEDYEYLAAACAYQAGENEKARKLFEKYLEDYPTGKYRKSCELPLARLNFDEASSKGDNAKALENARRAYEISRSPTDALRLAWWYETSSRPEWAKKMYDEIASSNPGSVDAVEALYRKAMLEIRASMWSAAELSLAEAMKSSPNHAKINEMRYWRGMTQISLGHKAEGAKLLKEALEGVLPIELRRESRIALADIAFEEGDFVTAKKSYASLVAEGATERMSAKKILSVGRFLIEEKSGDAALREAKLCASSLASVATTEELKQEALFLKAHAEEAEGHFAAAIASYRDGFNLSTRTERAGNAAVRLGALETKAGNFDEAEKILREAVELNSKDSSLRCNAYMELATLSLGRKDVRAARAYATIIITLFDDPVYGPAAQKLLNENPEEAK
ncbi:MAG: tetratricopeptide repeat protein [Kiritimatiellae bacterium]|nr:tetratricopeptide repeat protein [Kiritimatiellia bacterium]